MKTIEVCPSTLRSGFTTYSPQAIKELFDGVVVSPFIDIDFENERDQQQAMENMKNFSLINRHGEYLLTPAYDLINTCIHIQSGSDLGLLGGLSPDIEKSDVYGRTGHPCRLDFERFAERIGLPKKRTASVLDMFMEIPQETYTLINHSFLDDKMKRTYKRVIEERKTLFIRQSE